MSSATELSPTMRRVLLAIHRGESLSSRTKTQDDYGGMAATLLALRRRGLVDHEHKLTGIGQEAVRAIMESKR